MELGAELGGLLRPRGRSARDIARGGRGKAALVGTDGELEHAAAILHPKLGAPLRTAVEKGAALVPSSKKRGGPGQTLDIRSVTRMRPMSAAISTAWRSGSTMHRGRMKSCRRRHYRFGGARCRARRRFGSEGRRRQGRSSMSPSGRRRPIRLREF